MYLISEILIVLLVERQIKALKIFGVKTWCTKKPFGYQVVHHGYTLKVCQGQIKTTLSIIYLLKNF